MSTVTLPGIDPAAVAERVRIEVEDHVALVTLTRPDKHNALDPVCAGRIGRARDRLEQVARTARNSARAAEPG